MKIGIVGCAGRMGRMLMAQVLETDGAELAAGSELPDGPFIGQDLGILAGRDPIGISVRDDAAGLFAASDAVIDFTLPAATAHHAALAVEHGTALVIGTTGLDDTQQGLVADASRTVPVLQAPNMSIGVNLLFALTQKVAAILGEEYDIEIVEMHHRRKVDAPSGTALGLGRAAAEGRGVNLASMSDRVRDGHTGAREAGRIGFATLRGGDVVGDHSVIFAADGERVELTHKAANRSIFASGAVRAALWLENQPPGLYSMLDVLDLG